MAQVSKFVAGLITTSCLQLAYIGKASAQSFTDLELDRMTVQSVVNARKLVPAPSDPDAYDQAPDAKSGTKSGTTGVSPTNNPADAGVNANNTADGAAYQPLRPAITLPGDNTMSTGAFTVPGDGTVGTPTDTAPGTQAITTKADSATSGSPDKIDGRALAQNVPNTNNDVVQTDLQPVRLPERNTTFGGFDAFRTKGLYRLPGRVFFDVNVENSIRLEVNTFQTNRHYLSDFIYRVLPNITVGYALTRNTRVAANYFFLRDQYTLRNDQLSRNFHSVGGRVDHDFHLSPRTTLTTGFFPRVLFINTHGQPGIVYNDLLPSFVLTHAVNNGVLYASVIGQIRFRDILAKFQEGDQFYSLGGAWRKGKWLLLADSTLITNFGNRHLRQGPNNQNIIMTFEAGRKILPAVTLFARAQPIFNMGANHTPGYAGFNFRIFGGLRIDVGKPPIFPIKLKS